MSNSTKTIIFSVLAVTLAARPAAADDVQVKSSGDRKTISLELAKSEIRDALRLIAQSGNVNLIIGPDIEGNVSVHLDNVPVEVALKSIAVNNNLRYAVEDGVVTITRMPPADINAPPPHLVTRAFVLQAQDAARVKDAIEHVLTKNGKMTVLNENSDVSYVTSTLNSLSGDMNNNGSAGGGFSNGNGNGGGNTGASGNGGQSGGPGSSQANSARNSRTLVVTDTQEKVEIVASLIADLDRLPPQVLIEARIVEMSTNLQRQLGIDWNAEALISGPVLNHELPLRFRAGFAPGDQIRYNPQGLPNQVNPLSLGTIDLSRLTAMLRANQDDTAIRLLANPRMLIYNNHSANILVGERYPIFSANVSNFGTVTEAFQTYIPVGTQLEVTPTIMSDGRITLLVHPATSALGDDVIGTSGLHVARIQTREISTRVIMRDKETIVLGGLISDRKIHSARKVPGLGDWAVISTLFRQERPQSERVDLLVFLTANIDGATKISERDRKVFDMYKPHFKQVERLQDVPLHFEIPTEYEAPKPRFTDPPCENDCDDDANCTKCDSRRYEKPCDAQPSDRPDSMDQPADGDALIPLSSKPASAQQPVVRKVNMRRSDPRPSRPARAVDLSPVIPIPEESSSAIEPLFPEIKAPTQSKVTNHAAASPFPMNELQEATHEPTIRQSKPATFAPRSGDVRANQPQSIGGVSFIVEAAENGDASAIDDAASFRIDPVFAQPQPASVVETAPQRHPALPDRVRRLVGANGGVSGTVPQTGSNGASR